MVCTDFPKIEVAADVKVWLVAAYERFKAGERVNPQQMLVELWPKIPDFDYQSIDGRLMSFGVKLTLLGILQIDPDTELCDQTDQVIRLIKERIKKQPALESVTAKEVSEALGIGEERVALIFLLMDDLGHFWNGASGSGNVSAYTSITINAEHVKREYLRYDSLGPLLDSFAKKHNEQHVNLAPKCDFVHTLLDWKLDEHLEEARNSIANLPSDKVKTLDAESLAAIIEQFKIAAPVLAANPIRDERMPELVDSSLERKSGATGHIFFLTVDGDPEWLQEINMQTVVTDLYPLAFLNKSEKSIYIKLTVYPDDPEGTLKQKLTERLALIREYSGYVTKRIIEFNKELAEKVMQDLNSRKRAIAKGEIEVAAIGLDNIHNPQHAETAIKIERLMESLRNRSASPRTATSINDNEKQSGKEPADLHHNALKIAKHLYSNNFFGSRNIVLGELRALIDLSEKDFDAADEYLLEANISNGTAGGDSGMRWLTANGADFVKTNTLVNSNAIQNGQQSRTIDVFISHSSYDIAIAKALLLLFRTALNIAADRIRCTSVDGFKLPTGAHTDDQLRLEVRESKVFLGLITSASVESTYVLFELGARWGAELSLLPVLVKSDDKALLRGPLAAFSAVACDSRSQILQLLEDVASQLEVPMGKAASYQEQVDAVLEAANSNSRHEVDNLSDTKAEIDFERMAKHVRNYFAANAQKEYVRFGIIRKFVNEKYSDQMLFEMIDRFPEYFRRVMIRKDKRVVGLVKS